MKHNMISHKCVCLVWKSCPHPVGVFCTLLEPSNCHIMKKNSPEKSIFFIIFPINPFGGLPMEHSMAHEIWQLDLVNFMRCPNGQKSDKKLKDLPKNKVLRIGLAWCGNP